jgi:carbamoyl-phosphate synthase large subunit
MAEGPLKVLLTGAAGPGTRGTVRCVKMGDKSAEVIGTDIREECAETYLLDRYFQCPPAESKDYLSFMGSLCLEEKVDVVVPQSTAEAMAFSGNPFVTAVLVSPRKAMEVATDRWALYERFPEHRPRSRLVADRNGLMEAAEELGYFDEEPKRITVRPRVSDGGRGFRILYPEGKATKKEYAEEKPSLGTMTLPRFSDHFFDGFPELVVSEYLTGPEYSVYCFSGKEMCWAVPFRKTKTLNGVTLEAETTEEIRRELKSISRSIFLQLGLRFVFGLQFKKDKDGVPKLLECNPRVQATAVASAMCGANVVWWAIEEAMGKTDHGEPEMKDLKFFRYWGGVGIDGAGRMEMV